MRILIDADGCPVVDQTLKIAKQFALECLILCDTSHRFEREGTETLVFSKGADSVDFALVNLLRPGDVVVTQDYGLAAMCLARSALALNQDGMEYMERHLKNMRPVKCAGAVYTSTMMDICPLHKVAFGMR